MTKSIRFIDLSFDCFDYIRILGKDVKSFFASDSDETVFMQVEGYACNRILIDDDITYVTVVYDDKTEESYGVPYYGYGPSDNNEWQQTRMAKDGSVYILIGKNQKMKDYVSADKLMDVKEQCALQHAIRSAAGTEDPENPYYLNESLNRFEDSCESSEVCLGSVRIGNFLNNVVHIHGKPDKTVRNPEPVRFGDDQPKWYSAKHYYGDSVIVSTIQYEDKTPWVTRVDLIRNNKGWRTPSRLTVGTPIKAIPAYLRAKEGFNAYSSYEGHLMFHIKSGKIVDLSISYDPC